MSSPHPEGQAPTPLPVWCPGQSPYFIIIGLSSFRYRRGKFQERKDLSRGSLTGPHFAAPPPVRDWIAELHSRTFIHLIAEVPFDAPFAFASRAAHAR